MNYPAARGGYRSTGTSSEIVVWLEAQSADTHRGPIYQSSLHQRATLPKTVVIARPYYFPEVRPLGLISCGSPLAFKHPQPFDSTEHKTNALKIKVEGQLFWPQIGT